MRRIVASTIVGFLFLAGCALKVVPEPVNLGVINEQNNSQMITKDDVSVTVRNSGTEISSYNLDDTVAAFHVTIDNHSGSEILIGPESFLLLDDTGHQYFPLTPEKVKEMVSRDNYYLIPYPYVGFYYLEDYQKASYLNETTSQIPYFYQMYPQDIYTMSLPAGGIIPDAKTSGLIYFRIDLHDKQGVKLLIYKKGSSRSEPAAFTFPFKIR